MPPQAFALALGASIYPPALAAVIALSRGEHFRSRIFAFVLAAILVTYSIGVVLLLVLVQLGTVDPLQRSPSATVDLVLAAVLVAAAIVLRRKRPKPSEPDRESKIDRYLKSRRLAFALGVALYVLPSPIYVAAVKTIADTQLPTSRQLLTLAAAVVVMLWLVELPMLMLVLAPARATSLLESTNLWFARHGRQLAVVLCLAAAAYLAVKGLVDLLE